MAIDIRPMTIDDYDQILALWENVDTIGPSPSDGREGVKRYLERNPGISHVAREGGHLVGAVLCGHDGRRGYLTHLAVTSHCRRRGIGRALIERCVALLQREGLIGCNLFILNSNTTGRRFWESAGWTWPDYWSVMGRRFDEE